MAKRFLWDLTRRELMQGVRAFLKATKLDSGSIAGAYSLYDCVTAEWQKAKRKHHNG